MSESPGITLQAAPGLKAASGRHAFDWGRLHEYLATRLEGWTGPVSECAQFSGGQSNPTFLLKAGGKQYVLRRRPAGQLLPQAHAIDREFRVTRALLSTEVPVATPLLYCDDVGVIGSEFYISQYVAGRVFWDPSLPGMQPNERAAIYDEENRVIAALHSMDPAALGLADHGRPGNYFERQIARWVKQYKAAQTVAVAAMDHLMEWLPRNIPPDEEPRIVHGDFRIDNLIFHPVEPRVVAVLDWELSTLGNPLVDFSYHCLAWHLKASVSRGMAGSDLAALGIPDEQSYVAAYVRRTGRAAIDPATWRACIAFNLFKIAAILQGIMKRAIDGSASNASADNVQQDGERLRAIAECGWLIANGEAR